MSSQDSKSPEPLPDTQRDTDDSLQFTPFTQTQEEDFPWGTLHPKNTRIATSPISLKKEKMIFSAGRDDINQYVFTEANVGKRIVKRTSKVHFQIIHEDGDGTKPPITYIHDLSSNGTFVDGKLIGKNQKRVLCHGDTIAIIKAECRLFAFWSHLPRIPGIPVEIDRNYLVLSRIGKGGFGEVFLTMDKTTSEQLAMKVIEMETDRPNCNPLKEPDFMYKLKHLNIVSIYGSQSIEKKVYIFMEYMRGGNLSEFVNERNRLSEKVAKHIIFQIINGVDELHRKKIIHRDIKPLNILLNSLDDFPLVKITDFGLSKNMKYEKTEFNTICGTVSFAAPELLQTTRGAFTFLYDQRCDIWSIGIVMYYCLSGSLPFRRTEGDVAKQVMKNSIKFEPVAIWKTLSLQSKTLIFHMCQKEYTKRPHTSNLLKNPYFLEDSELRNRCKFIEMQDENTAPPSPKRFKC